MEIVIQYQEDHPGNPGWWRFSRPVHRVVEAAPPISDSIRWFYGSAEDARYEQERWDRQYGA